MNEIADNVRKELLALQNMTERELKEKWLALYGKKAPNYNVPFLRRRLAYRIQELAYGGVKSPTLKKIRDTKAQVRMRKDKRSRVNLRVGTIICRIWRQQRYEVTVLPDGFEWNGTKYSTLSAVAKKICGVNRNGFEFFGIQRG